MHHQGLLNFWFFLTITFAVLSCSASEGNQNPVEQKSKGEEVHTRRKYDFISYVAEWEYEGKGGAGDGEDDWDSHSSQGNPSQKTLKETLDFPSTRVGPATWQDATGSWWLFGGQGPNPNPEIPSNNSSIQFLSDLWMYSTEVNPAAWKPLFSTQRSKIPLSSYPDNLAFPILCGSSANSHVTVFGYGNTRQDPDPGHNLLFTDDNVVWLYDIPTAAAATNPAHKSSSSNENDADTFNGIWTSYVCCDQCLPDDNTTTLEFCPHFSDAVDSEQPIIWCSDDSLMALQLTPKSSTVTQQSKSSIESSFKNQIQNPFPPTTVSPTSPPAVSPSPALHRIPSANAILENKSNSNSSKKSSVINSGGKGTLKGGSAVTALREEPHSLNWWKFDLGATEWVKMPGVRLPSEEIGTQILGPNCRTVSDGAHVYILCPPGKERKSDPLMRDVFVFDPSMESISCLPTLTLNNGFRDKRIWQLGRSVLHALRTQNNQTIIFLAYQKLLDLWIHDHSTGRFSAVENVWKGSTLHKFQTWKSFYKLRITITEEGKDSDPLIVFLPNPRSKLFTFNDPAPDSLTTFHIRIESDQSVFLPSRDASFLINPGDQVSNSSSPTEEQSSEPLTSTSKPNSTSTPTSTQTNLIGSLVSGTMNPMPMSGKGKEMQAAATGKTSNLIDSKSTEMTKVILEPANHSNVNDNGSKILSMSKERRLNASVPVTNTNTSIPRGNVTTASFSAPLPPVTHTHSHVVGLSKQALGIKRGFVKGAATSTTIDPQRIGESDPGVNNERVGGGGGKAKTTPTVVAMNRNYSNENRKKIPKTRLPPPIQASKSNNSEEEILAMAVKNNDKEFHAKIENEPPQAMLQQIIHDGYGNSSQRTENTTPSKFLTATAEKVTIQETGASTTHGGGEETDEERKKGNDSIKIDSPENDGREDNKGLTYSSSEVLLDPSTILGSDGDSMAMGNGISGSDGSPYSSMLFFAISISFFATIGIVLFFRRCVKCPPRRQSVLLKEPPPIRYSVIPDELSYHTPIV